MHKYTPLAESDSTEASTMHGVRHAVACSVQGDEYTGSLKFMVLELRQVHTHLFNVVHCRGVISASKVSRIVIKIRGTLSIGH